MPEKTKEKKDDQKEIEDFPENKDDSSWSRDQREKSYYYDDAHGYEIYNPEDEDDEEMSQTKNR